MPTEIGTYPNQINYFSAHQQEQPRLTYSQMMQEFDCCVRELENLQTAKIPFDMKESHRLEQLNAKSLQLEGPFNTMLREGIGKLPGMTLDTTKKIFDNSQLFKKALEALSVKNLQAVQQQTSNQHRNSGRSGFNRQIDPSSQRATVNRSSPNFATEMQEETNHFSEIAEGISKGYLKLSPQKILVKADQFERFDGFTQRNNVQIDPNQRKEMLHIFGQAKQFAKQQLEQGLPQQQRRRPLRSPSGSSLGTRASVSSSDAPSLSMQSTSSSLGSMDSGNSKAPNKSTAKRIGSWIRRQTEKMGAGKLVDPGINMTPEERAQRDKNESDAWRAHNEKMKGVTIMTMEKSEKLRNDARLNGDYNPNARTGQRRG